jgi:hypothetical protein
MTHNLISKISEYDRQMLSRFLGERLDGATCIPFKRTSLVNGEGYVWLYTQKARILIYKYEPRRPKVPKRLLPAVKVHEPKSSLLGFDLYFRPSEWGIFGIYGIPVFEWIDIIGDKRIQAFRSQDASMQDALIYMNLIPPRIIKKITIHGSSFSGLRKPEDEFDEEDPFFNTPYKNDLDMMLSFTCDDGTICAFEMVSRPDPANGTVLSIYEEESAFLEHVASVKNYFGEPVYDTHWLIGQV